MPAILLSMIILLCVIFWNTIVSEIEIIGALATALAFFATSWAAYEARSSAKAAFKAVELTRESLFEAKKTAFKQWLSLLLEKCDEMHKEVELHLSNNKNLVDNLNPDCNLEKVYNSIVKDSILSSYVRHIYHTLDYIDKEFYGSASDINGKRSYAEQLSNTLSDRVKTIIAIYGLKYNNIDHIDRTRLRNLLQNLNFFKNDLFFPSAINERQYISNYISNAFYKRYRKNFYYNIESQIERSTYSSLSSDFTQRRINANLFFSILLNYENPAQTHIENCFKNYATHTENELLISLAAAKKDHKKNIEILKQYKGLTIRIDRRNGKHIKSDLKTIAEILNISRKYISKKNKHTPARSILNAVYLYNPQQNSVIREHVNFYPSLHAYCKSLAFLKLQADKNKNDKVKQLISLFNSELKRELDSLKLL